MDKERSEDAGIDAEQGARDAKEKGRETDKEGGALQKTGQKMLKPVKGAFDKIKEWFIKLFAAKAIMMFMDWFSDPANAKKVESIFRFIKDWWPAIVTGLLLFAGSLLGPTGIIIGITALVVGFIPKIVNGIKSIFGFGKDTAREAAKGEKEASKAEKLADKQDKGTSGDDLKPDDDPANAPEPGTQETPGEKAPLKMNKGGEVPGSGDKDTVPAMLTPGEFVMSKGAVQKYGANTLASMNAMGGGTNRPTLRGGFNEGGKVKTMSERLGHTRGTVTDPKEKARIEAETLAWVNKERVEFLGLPPLDKITYADGVELTKAMGKEYYGAGIKEESHTDMDFDNMIQSTWKTKSRGSEIIFEGASKMLTEEDKQAYLDSNPQARMALELKDQMELDALGADISASARMNGGGLVQGFKGGGGVELIGPAEGWGKAKVGSKKFSGAQLKGLLDSQKGIGTSTLVKKKSPVMKVVPKPVKVPQINPPIVLPVKSEIVSATKVNQKVKQEQIDNNGGGSKIPNFDAEKYISVEKVATLGMTV